MTRFGLWWDIRFFRKFEGRPLRWHLKFWSAFSAFLVLMGAFVFMLTRV